MDAEALLVSVTREGCDAKLERRGTLSVIDARLIGGTWQACGAEPDAGKGGMAAAQGNGRKLTGR